MKAMLTALVAAATLIAATGASPAAGLDDGYVRSAIVGKTTANVRTAYLAAPARLHRLLRLRGRPSRGELLLDANAGLSLPATTSSVGGDVRWRSAHRRTGGRCSSNILAAR